MKWTNSEANTFRQCRRKFFLSEILPTHHYGNKLRRKAFELKNTQNLKMWVGTVVDKYISTKLIEAIVQNRPLDFDRFAEEAVELAESQFKFSEQGLYRQMTKVAAGAEYCILDIHELGQLYPPGELEYSYQTIRQAILNIPRILMPDGEPLVKYLQEAYSLYPDVTNRYTEIEEANVGPQIDLLAYVQGKPVVFDWKVSLSETSDYSRQLVVIGLTILRHRNHKMKDKHPYQCNDIRLLEVNLIQDGGYVREHAFTRERANEIQDDINLSSGDILLLTQGRSHGDIPISDFPGNENGGYICDTCQFYPLCTYLNIHNNEYDEKAYTEFVRDCQCA